MSGSRASAPYWGLPTELLILICDHAHLEAKAALALTSHLFLSIVGRDIFKEFDSYPHVWDLRLSRSHFLRKLQRDRPNKELYICYQCISFHRVSDRHPYQRSYARSRLSSTGPVGFPTCRNLYTQGLQEIHDSLSLPLEKHQRKHMYTGYIMSPVILNYLIITGIRGQDLFTKRRLVLKAKEGQWGKYFMVPSSFLRQANLEICPHTSFGRDYVKGDGSINDDLHTYYVAQHESFMEARGMDSKKEDKDHERMHGKKKTLPFGKELAWRPDPFHGYVCQECCLEVGIEWAGLDVEISVWQYMGRLKTGQEMDNEQKGDHPYKSILDVLSPSNIRGMESLTIREGEHGPFQDSGASGPSSLEPFKNQLVRMEGLKPGMLRKHGIKFGRLSSTSYSIRDVSLNGHK